MFRRILKSPLYWATLAGVTAAGLAIVAMPGAQAAPANRVTSLAGTGATGSSSTDTQPPTTPTNLAASFRCDSTQGILLTLNWTASTDNVGVTGYDVYFARGASSGPFAFVATTATTSYTQPVTAGSYEVRARDAAGNTSDLTAPLLVLPPPSPCPTHPADHGTCTAAYGLGSSWPGGFQGQVTVKNTGTDAARSWTVTLAFADGQTVSQVWGASMTSATNPYTFGSLAYNATLAPGRVHHVRLPRWLERHQHRARGDVYPYLALK